MFLRKSVSLKTEKLITFVTSSATFVRTFIIQIISQKLRQKLYIVTKM